MPSSPYSIIQLNKAIHDYEAAQRQMMLATTQMIHASNAFLNRPQNAPRQRNADFSFANRRITILFDPYTGSPSVTITRTDGKLRLKL